MIECLSCQTPNSIDSQFCKGCGKALSTDAIEAALLEHEAFVSEGQRALADGRIDEAMLIAQSAVEQSPESVNALSLRGMIFERQGRIAEALEAFERVVALNPNSSLDKIKVQQLRNSLSTQLLYAPQPDKKRALIGAMAAVLLVVGAGAIIAVYAQRANADKNDADNRMALSNSLASGNPLKGSELGSKPNVDPAAGTSGATDPNKPKNPGDVPAIRNNVEGGVTNQGTRLSNGPGISLPPAGPDSGFKPFPVGEPTITSNTTNSQQNSGNENPDPTVGENNGTNSSPPAVKSPQGDPGVIEIKTSQKNPTSRGGGTDVDQGMSSKALSEAARTQFGLQKYDQAAKSYERLLSMGGDPATINQRLGQCYSNLGQTGSAASAYKRAISALEDRLKNSSGDTSYLDRQLESCKRALKVLGG